MSKTLHRRWIRPRRLLGVGALLLMMAVLAVALMPRPKAVTVRMSIPEQTLSATFYIAMDKGCLRDEGVRVDVTVPVTGKAGLQMLTAGSMDLAMVAGMPVIDAILHGQPLWVLAAVGHFDRYVGLAVPADVERFEQLQGKRVGSTPGTTIERHGGRIWIESAPGQGATVFLPYPSKGTYDEKARRDIFP